MVNEIKSIELKKLAGHPDNANVQSKVTFGKMMRHIKRTGLYEPLVVRPMPGRKEYYQVINGHHRLKALEELGYRECDCVVWEVDDEETEILLLTLNRLGGRDKLSEKLRVLKRLNKVHGVKELGRLLPQSAKQIERLVDLKKPEVSLNEGVKKNFVQAAVFFVDEGQERVIEEAILHANKGEKGAARAVRRGTALAEIACRYIQSIKEDD
ncbi:MAG: ParB/RepB/Spo0J family partition protein [Planctomycetota bacterium]|jgi:ParB-like chromosome segregation protein Spo0J